MTTETNPRGTSFIDQILDATLSRRRFLGGAGALAVAFALSPRATLAATQPRAGDDPAGTPVGGWVVVAADGTITILYGGAEMGQGTSTGLAQAMAEELGARWSDIAVQNAPVGASWTTGVPWTTGGSSGITRHIAAMRVAGAQAREMLKAAAADAWGLPDTSNLITIDSTVRNTWTGLSLPFAQLAAVAATKPVPASPALLRTGQFVGVSVPRLDIPAKTNGSARYGIDVVIPGMAFAVVKNAPVLGGTLKATPKVPAGATAVVNLGNACAVVATNTWAAIMAAKQLSASWTTPADATSNSSAAVLATAQGLMTSGAGLVVAEGNPASAAGILGATPTLDQTYFLPYIAHAPMEVPNTTVVPTYDVLGTLTKLDIWASTQSPTGVKAAAAALVAPGVVINVHSTLLGGGLGRKIETDYPVHAVKTALGIKKPVKVIWPREEDVTHDQYRPMALSRVRASIDPTSKLITAWSNRIVSPSIAFQRGRLPTSGIDSSGIECAAIATGVPYVAANPNHAVEYVRHPSSIWVGYWRSVGASINVFVVESAIDELALAAGMDEYQFRRAQLLASTDPRAPRFLAVLEAAAALGGWSTPVPVGRARGISLGTCFGSVVGEVVEVSAPVAGALVVHKVAVAVDCGNVVNPNAVEAQMQGGVVHALSATLWGQITFTAGKADQNNFNKYRMLRGREMPVVSTTIIRSTADPTGGVGEVAVPGIASAIVTAYAKATKTARIRSLPMFPAASTMAG